MANATDAVNVGSAVGEIHFENAVKSNQPSSERSQILDLLLPRRQDLRRAGGRVAGGRQRHDSASVQAACLQRGSLSSLHPV